MPFRTDALEILEHAIARAGGAKVMLRLDEALAIRAALKGKPAADTARELLAKVRGKASED
jgi:hypothetical protein